MWVLKGRYGALTNLRVVVVVVVGVVVVVVVVVVVAACHGIRRCRRFCRLSREVCEVCCCCSRRGDEENDVLYSSTERAYGDGASLLRIDSAEKQTDCVDACMP